MINSQWNDLSDAILFVVLCYLFFSFPVATAKARQGAKLSWNSPPSNFASWEILVTHHRVLRSWFVWGLLSARRRLPSWTFDNLAPVHQLHSSCWRLKSARIESRTIRKLKCEDGIFLLFFGAEMGSHKPHQLFKRIAMTTSRLNCKQMGVNQPLHLFAIRNGSETWPLVASFHP
jgi:hypothetical protein